jgi:hypothetical protein
MSRGTQCRAVPNAVIPAKSLPSNALIGGGDPFSSFETQWIPAEACPRMLESGAGMTTQGWSVSPFHNAQ